MRRVLLGLLLLCALAAPAQAGARNPLRPLDRAGLAALLTEPVPGRMVFFMASWCAPCRQELPLLERLWQRHKDRGLDLCGVSVDLEPGAMQELLGQTGVTFPVYWAGERAIDDYSLTSIPLLFILRNGKEAERLPGAKNEKLLEETIRGLLQEFGR